MTFRHARRDVTGPEAMASVTGRQAGFALGPETLQFPRDAGYYSLNEHHRERAEWLAASRAARYSKSVTRRVPRARSHGRRDLEPAEGPKGEWRAREPARLAAPRLQSPAISRRPRKSSALGSTPTRRRHRGLTTRRRNWPTPSPAEPRYPTSMSTIQRDGVTKRPPSDRWYCSRRQSIVEIR